ncbi:hypothetical protein N7466_000396 [Penicillium verhagenii]|uniref:uncharacterized protein n=1 Tax=Penicillium verhagenii TaxID=1562060 RepID=UPI0025452186|nr:uncharacterized protein N7466_000396 [Penicillium verhagenii]KAJ5947381.1 hypothetical protein N7466_000396 [Penicillium verhagenii]
MFGRRKRSRSSSHHQPLPTPASQSAQSAASHAFLKSQPSTSSLSSAAAAAALRNRTPTPTSVENVQTKRMVQRAASTHSPHNSMSNRRSASVSGPLRRANSSSSMSARTFREPSPHRPSTSSGPVNVQRTAGAPPLPNLPAQYTPQRQASRRAASLEPTMRSPPASPPRVSTRGVSSDRGGASSPLHNRISSLSTVPEFDRPGSRESVNFSYPRGARPNSPPLTPSIPEDQPISLGAVVTGGGAQGSGTQQSTPEKSTNTRPKDQVVEGSQASKSAGPSVGAAAAAAAQAVGEKSSSRADPSHARVDQLEHDPSSISSPDNEHPSSRTGPERRPVAVREIEPEVNAKTEASRNEAGNRLSAASPTSDRVDTIVTPQSSPSAAKGLKEQEVNPHQSNSPGRSARFSKWLSVSSSGDQIHQPPARSVSPVKSALKHPRGSSLSPERKVSLTGQPIHPPSEISDGTSVGSDEGHRLGVKKRAPKVSFDDEAEIVGVAASPPTSPEDYTAGSPPKSKSRMSWLGVGKKKQASSDYASGDDDFGAVLKPRSVLPSFGSVRGNRDGGSQEPVIPEYSDNDSSDSSDDEAVVAPISFSHDHAIGGILPNVRSQDTTNMNTVERFSVNGEHTPSQPKAVMDKRLDGMAIGGITEQPPFNAPVGSNLPPPSIAVEPATPPVDSDRPSRELQRAKRSSLEQYQIPGGFPPSASDRSLKSTAESQMTKNQPVANAVPKHVDDVDTEGESGDSVYSDAEEGFDGDGFGSINAIVDSKSIPRSAPVETASESRDPTPKPLDRAVIIEDASQDITDQAADEGRVTPTQDSVDREVEGFTTTMPALQEDEPSSPSLPLNSNPRGATNGTTHPGPRQQKRPMSVDMYGTSNLNDPRHSSAAPSTDAGNGKTRPLSLGPAFQRTGRSGEAGFPSSLRRARSSGSDSSSSFKRASHSPRSDGSHGMRRTMRAGANIRGPPSDRTDSPTDRRPMSSGSSQGPGTLRKTLRGPPGGGNERGYSFFSTNKKAAPAPRARSTKPPPKSMTGSRFGDSDDEGDRQQQVFHSRFADSSDEEQGQASMRPVRGIPRRQGAHDGDSTDLEDSSEGERRQQSRLVAAPTAARVHPTPPASRDKNAPNMSGMAAVARQRGMTQQELEEFVMRPQKQGFLTRIGLKKPKYADNRIRKLDAESPSRKDTHLERSQLQREQIRGASVNGPPAIVTTVTANQPQSPPPQKLVKKDSKRYTTGGEPWSYRSDAKHEPIPEQSTSAPSSPLRTQKPALDEKERNGIANTNGGGEAVTDKIPESPQPLVLVPV